MSVSLYSGPTSTSCPRGSNKAVFVMRHKAKPLKVHLTLSGVANLPESVGFVGSVGIVVIAKVLLLTEQQDHLTT